MATYHYDVQIIEGSSVTYSVDPPDLYVEADSEHEAEAKVSEMYQLRAGETFVLVTDNFNPTSKAAKKEVPPEERKI